MHILEKKDKNSIALKIYNGKVYVALENKKEEDYLKYAAHLLSNDLLKAVYKLDTKYLFITKADDELAVDARSIENESEARFEIDSFFEGRSAEVFDEPDIPDIRKGLLSDKRLVLAFVLAAIGLFYYALFMMTEPENYKGIVRRDMVSVPAPLNESEKDKLRVIGSRLAAERIGSIISSVRPDKYIRIAALTVQRTETPLSISYVVTTGKEYLYPETGSISGKDKGIWSRTEASTIAVERKDIRPVEGEGFDACAIHMMERGFYVKERGERCTDFLYEGGYSKAIAQYNSISGCYIALNSLNVAAEKSALDITLCKQ